MNSGFSLHSLSKLESTKSYDGKTNLLDFVEKSLGDNVDFVASMGSVLKARQVNLGDMSKSVNDILSRLDRVGHLHLVNDNIDHLVRDAKRQLHDLLRVVDNSKSCFQDLLVYFGETQDDDAITSEEYFSELASFFQSFTCLHVKNRKGREEDKRKRYKGILCIILSFCASIFIH